MNKFFDVIYSGQLASNVQGDESVKQFSILFKISQEKSRNIVLGNKEFVIKKNIDRATAQKYKEKLSQIGLIIHIHESIALQTTDKNLSQQQSGAIEKIEAKQNEDQHTKFFYNPYQSPQSNLLPQPNIDELDVSEKWKKRFHLIEEAGGPKLPYIKELSFSERMQIMGNILSYIFWPIYLPIKGLWRPALCYFALGVALGIILEMTGFERASRAIGYGVSAIVMMRTNINYYRHKVLGEKFWF